MTCTFTNTKRGKIIVREVTIPSGDPQSFTFTRSYGADFNLTDYNPETTSPQNESGFLEHGLFSVSETVPPGWELTSIICNDAESSGNTTTATATVNVDPGETVR